MALLSISEPGEKPVKSPSKRRLALGIDLGTTHSLVATVIDGASGLTETIPDQQGRHLLPSVVQYLASGGKVLGYEAQQQSVADPQNTIASVKRLMGRGLDDISYALPYELVLAEAGGMPVIKTSSGNLSPIEVSADILAALVQRGEAALAGKIDGVVITVPAYFDEAQRQATKDAARLANLKVLRLLSEPTAAAVAYGLESKLEGTVIIYDLGGGTFDVSLMRLEQGVFEVLATGGDAALGGDDFDRVIVDWLIEVAALQTPLEPSRLNFLLQLAREAKHTLSEVEQVELTVDSWSGLLTRDKLYSLTQKLVTKTLKACRRVLRDGNVAIDEISDVVMVGGSTRSPLIRERVAEFFQQELLTSIDPDRVVAIGAAIQADVLVGNKYGSDLLLLDVIPLSLGVETMGGLMEKIIPRNTTIPVARAQEFTTFKDGQTVMSLHVLQGERELISECRSLAKFDLSGIPPMVAGAARVKVTFQVDADGLMEVQAHELVSGVTSSVQVKPSFGLADKQIEEMIKNSYEQAHNDKLARALKETQVEGLRIIEALTAALKIDANILAENEIQALEAGLVKLQAAVVTDDIELIEKLSIELNLLSTDFAALRMDSQIKLALAGKSLLELDE